MKISRRKFIVLSFLGIIGFTFLDAFWMEKYIVKWSRHDLRTGKKNTLKIIQLTDLHIKRREAYHRWIARRIGKENPDLLFFTGDTINYPSQIGYLEEMLERIPKSIPKFIIMGNKEYDGTVRPELYKKLFAKHNGKILINETTVFSKGSRKINIVGIDDMMNGKPNIEKSVTGIDPSLETIILNHCPQYRDYIDKYVTTNPLNIKLVLSGHTHGGQIQLFGKAFYTPDGSGKYLDGFYNSPQSLMYVSRGLGTSYLPLRFGARAEAPIFYI